MWLAWGIITLAVASGAAQDSSPAQAELSHDSSVTVRHSIHAIPEGRTSHKPTSQQTSLTVLGSSPSGSYSSHKVMRTPLYAPFFSCEPCTTPPGNKARCWWIACNPNLILCLASHQNEAHYYLAIQGSPSEADSANEGRRYLYARRLSVLNHVFFLAARAYKQALATLATLTSIPSSRAFEAHHQFSWNSGNSILSSILPNPQGQGPLSSALRIAIKLRHQSWLPRFLSTRFFQESGRRRSDEELRRRAIKVMDLLQHAADLGHLDALSALAKISLVVPSYSLCPRVISFHLSFRLPHTSMQTLYLLTKLSRPMLP